MNAVLLASAGVAIALVGGGIGFWIGRSGAGGSKARVRKAEAELEEYKRNVTEHFSQTAAHFQAIGKQYRELYDHMAGGAQALCEPDEAGKQLLFAPGADAESTDAEEPATEAVEEAEARPPMDYVEQPAKEEAAEAAEVTDEPIEEQTGEKAAEAEKAETGAAEGTDSDKAAEPPTDAKSEAGARTLH